MRTNKVFILAFACLTLLFTGSTFAQTSVTNTSGIKTPGSKGFVAGLVYSNLSDSKTTADFSHYRNGVKVRDTSETSTSGQHIGLMGLHLGYKNIYASGTWGINAGIEVLRGLNGSETPSKVTLYKVLSNAVLPLTDYLALSGGLNVSYFGGLSDGDVTVNPGLGAQVGVEVRMKQVSILVGTQLLSMNQKWSNSYSDMGTNFKSEGDANFLLSGVITQLSYTF